MCVCVQSADIRFAVQQLISAARNEHGLIRERSAQTTTRVVGYAKLYLLPTYIHIVLNCIEMWEHIFVICYIYIYIYIYI